MKPYKTETGWAIKPCLHGGFEPDYISSRTEYFTDKTITTYFSKDGLINEKYLYDEKNQWEGKKL